MKRRLVLARALVNDPDLIFLDEPTTGLDPQARHLMWERLRLLLRQGKTILLTTHFMDEAERLCDRLTIIDHGRTLAEGTPRALIAEHIEPEVVEVYGEGVEAWFAGAGAGLAARAELHGETAFCYLRDADAGRREPARATRRCASCTGAANLEDLFLKLTGPGDARMNARPVASSSRGAGSPSGGATTSCGGSSPPSQRARATSSSRSSTCWASASASATMVPEVEGVKYIAFLAGGTICYSTMLSASFEALYSGFARMHVQRTWEGILNAPVSLEDVVIAEWVWAASKSFLSGTAVLLVAVGARPGAVVDDGAHRAARLPDRPHLRRHGPGDDGAREELRLLHVLVHAGAHAADAAVRRLLPDSPNMPGWLQAVANALPLTHAIALGRPLFLGQWPEAALLHVAVLAAYGIAGSCIALALFRRRLLA